MLLFFLLTAVFARAAPLERIENCTFIETPWADGDSFLIRTPMDEELTVRLYGADCMEWHVTDPNDERRLRTQRRYFGITTISPDPRTAIQRAKGFGEEAAVYVRQVLAKPFTIFTSRADARGDGRYKRIYAFVVTSEGDDLAARLVEQGMARAFGVSRETYLGWSQHEYREHLRDLELKAATSRVGIWTHTNWASLPEERRTQRTEDAEVALAIGSTSVEEGEELDPNTAARDDLMRLPGIGEAFANRIIENRPYQTLEDLLNVPGIGPVKFEQVRQYLKIQSVSSAQTRVQ